MYVDHAALREEIGATARFQGITGILSRDDFGDCGTGNVNIYQHQDSTITDPRSCRWCTISRREPSHGARHQRAVLQFWFVGEGEQL